MHALLRWGLRVGTLHLCIIEIVWVAMEYGRILVCQQPLNLWTYSRKQKNRPTPAVIIFELDENIANTNQITSRLET